MINYPISIYYVVDDRCNRAFLEEPLRKQKQLVKAEGTVSRKIRISSKFVEKSFSPLSKIELHF